MSLDSVRFLSGIQSDSEQFLEPVREKKRTKSEGPGSERDSPVTSGGSERAARRATSQVPLPVCSLRLRALGASLVPCADTRAVKRSTEGY